MKKLIITIIIALICSVNVLAAEKSLMESYREDTGTYIYYLNDNCYFESTEQLGKTVSNIIRLTYNDYVKLSLYKDGELQAFKSGDYIYGEGNYTVVIKDDSDIGRVNFIMSVFSEQDYNYENDFYNSLKLVQGYDKATAQYTQTMTDCCSFRASVPNMALTDKSVIIYMPEDEKLEYTITRNGEEYNFRSGKTIAEEGRYCLRLVYDADNTAQMNDFEEFNDEELNSITEEDIENAEAEDVQTTDILAAVANVAEYKFTIINSEQNMLNFITPPQDYKIASVVLDGKRQETTAQSCYRTENDGRYTFTFKSAAAGLPDYTFGFVRDTTAPKILTEGVNEKGIINMPFKIVKDDLSAKTEVKFNGAEIKTAGDTLDKDGLYVITISDAAGNKNTYMLNIDIPFRINPFVALAFIAAAAAAVILYVKYVKTHIQVR